jgi:hypothetical protein
MGTKWGAVSDTLGYFRIENLPPGYWNIKVTMMGYKPVVRTNVFVVPKGSGWIIIELEKTVIKLKGITVTPDYFGGVSISEHSLDREEIYLSPGSAEDILRVVKTLPSVVSMGDNLNEVVVRGGAPGENLLLLDNIPMPNTNHFAIQGSGGGAISIIDNSLVKKLDFYSGGFPARYGNKASSVMDITLREGSREKLRKQFHLGITGVGLRLDGPLKRNGSYNFAFHRTYIELLKLLGYRNLPDKLYLDDLQGKLVYDLTQRDRISVVGLYGGDLIRMKNQIVYSDTFNTGLKDYHTGIGANFRRLFGKKGYFLLTLYARESSWDWVHYYLYSGKPTYINWSKEGENGLKLYSLWELGPKGKINFGFEYKLPWFNYKIWEEPDSLFYYEYSQADPDSIIDKKLLDVYRVDIERKMHSYKYAGYIEYSRIFASRLNSTLGVRYDYFDYTRSTAISPKVRMAYTITATTTLNAAYGRYYQSPAYVILGADSLNHWLGYFYATHYIIGVEHLFSPDIRATLEAYYKPYKQIPIQWAYTTPNPNDWDNVYLSVGRSYAEGIDFYIQKKFTHYFHGSLAYSYGNYRKLDLRYNRKCPGDYDYRNIFTLVGGYEFDYNEFQWYRSIKDKRWFGILTYIPFLDYFFGDRVKFSFCYRYLGGRPYTPLTYERKYKRWILDEATPVNSKRTRPYARLDFRIDNRVIKKNYTVSSYIEIMNIFDRENIWDYNYSNEDATCKPILQYPRIIGGGGLSIEF